MYVGHYFHAQDPIPGCFDWWHKLYYRILNIEKKTNNKLLLIVIIAAQSYGLFREMIRVWARETVYYHLDKANKMTNIDTGKWQKINLCSKRKNKIGKRKHGVLVLHMHVHMCLAYRLHIRQSGHSRKSIVRIVGHLMAVKYPDPV